EGDPTKKGCRPQLPSQTKPGPGQTLPPPKTQGLTVVSGETRVFTMEPGNTQAKIVFQSVAIEADEAKNRELCGSSFFAVARTVGGQINDACRLKAAPSEPVEGRMACAVTVSFENPQTYMDRVCNVTASFERDGETRVIQVLKK